MGTDIHMAVEVRREGIWRYNRPKTLCRWYAETWTTQADVDEANKRVADYYAANPTYRNTSKPVKLGDRKYTWDRCKYKLPEFFTDRNYRVFAVLGNVRNGSGFAGVYTHDAIPFISDNRGHPEGVTREALAKLSNEHSETWVDLAELKAYDYRQTITEGGVIDEQTFLKMLIDNRDAPDSWSGMVSGALTKVLTTDQYAALYESPIDLLQGKAENRRPTAAYNAGVAYHIQHVWKRSLYDEVSAIPGQMIPYLEKLVPKGGSDEDVRLVFDFDS